MSSLNRASLKFLSDYAILYPAASEAAKLICNTIESAIGHRGYFIHSITARAKTPQSLREKLRRKSYSSPHEQLTDIVGARVITYYRDAVDPIAQNLRELFLIDNGESVDKRQALGLRQFGYRSVHLIAKLKSPSLRPNQFLKDYKFEIQIRSILEHAWAEIEHEIVYKSGIAMRDDTTRRFAALAGSLELFDGEFLSLRHQREGLIAEYAARYGADLDHRVAFDVARLLAFLEVEFPLGRSWRQAESEGTPFAAGLEVSCVEALRAAGLATPASLKRILKSVKFRRNIKTFSAAAGIDPARVSHLATIILALAAKKPALIKRHFPEMLFDMNIHMIVDRRTKPSRRALRTR